MPLCHTIVQIRKLLSDMQKDLVKAEKGNRAAAQRVRTGSVLFSKVAKSYRKESVAAEKKLLQRSKKRHP